MNCRFCGATLEHEFIDLVGAPPSNAFLSEEQINEPEVYYPLKLYLCTACFLVQIDEYKKSADIFDSGYVYFSSYSTTWLDHAKRYVDRMIQAFRYDGTSLVIEIASNDGYLLQYFKERGIPCLGIEPAAIKGYDADEFTHMSVAVAVLSGSADAGLGIYAAAKALDLDFIPVVTEKYDLVIPVEHFESEFIQTLLGIITSAEFKRRVEGLGGYNTHCTGEIIDIGAA